MERPFDTVRAQSGKPSEDTHNPQVIIISGAIGSGKGTVVHALVHELGFTWVPTHTTRPMRRDDPALSQRVFDTETTFLRHLARGEFIESVEKGGNRYGLLRHDLERELRAGKPVIIEMGAEGGIKVNQSYPNVMLIFLLTDEKVRRQRITARSMNNAEAEKRMKEAVAEEKLAREHYDYLIENIEGHPEEAIEAVKNIVLEQFSTIQHK
jgi:guanylate kinase